MSTAPRTALFAERIFDGKTLLPRGVDSLLAQDGRVLAIGTRAEIGAMTSEASVDFGADSTLTPGLMDAHMHFFGVDTAHVETLHTESEAYRALRAARDAGTLLRSGYTTVRCLGSSIGPAVARAIRDGIIDGPLVIPAGQFVCSSAGTWNDLDSGADADLYADGADACREIVRRRARQGALVIKIGASMGPNGDHFHSWGDDPGRQEPAYSLDEIRSITTEAHSLGLKVSAHSIGDAPVRNSVLGGVDIIEHGHGISDETRQLMVDRGTVLIPTFSHSEMLIRKGPAAGISAGMVEAAERHLPTQFADFRMAVRAGIEIVAGSDRIGPPWASFDETGLELVLMAENGMSPTQALRAGTSLAARALGVEGSRGRIAVGMAADILAFAGDPTTNIRVVERPYFVMQDGHIRRDDRPAAA